MELRESKTKINLLRAFAGESQARNRYDIAAEKAKKEGLHIIESLFKYTANQEKAHAEVFLSKLNEFSGCNISIDNATYPIEGDEPCLKLLQSAAHNEFEEHDKVYKEFAETARSEGFADIATLFENIAAIEKIHGDRFKRYAQEIENATLFKKDMNSKWMCANCGYIYEGPEPPKNCPVCGKPQGYALLFENSLFE
ncbi:rubrerythrin [uncultured Clostridium sp.]|uniref:rubrerythrin n=1 Tax=uncultured Clostridium sp. TaxID=59620 RepID=UPI0025E82B6A|nr:rubrerythrin family protein [uncultured Clostridium sp.]